MRNIFQLKVRSSIKTKRTEIITDMRGSSPPKYLFFTQFFFSNFNYFFYGLCDSGVILKELGQNLSFSVKSKVLKRGQTPLYT